MAISKTLLAFLLLLFALCLVYSYGQDMVIENLSGDNNLSQEIDCHEACDTRCQLSSRPRLCHRACGTCCARCNCVPPGTSDNYDACPCYANMTTHGGKHKCP